MKRKTIIVKNKIDYVGHYLLIIGISGMIQHATIGSALRYFLNIDLDYYLVGPFTLGFILYTVLTGIIEFFTINWVLQSEIEKTEET